MKARDHSIDALRGLAIFIMIFANAAPYILPEPHAFFFRALDSYAAPVFIALAGFGISFAKRNSSPLLIDQKLIFRALLTLLVAALIDSFVWGLTPFVSYDVLYLIGFGVLLAAFLDKIPNWVLMGIVLLIVGFTFYLHESGSYQELIPSLALNSENLGQMLHSWDFLTSSGWFPIFPWLAIFLLGYLGGRKKPRFGRYKLLYTFAFFAVFNYTLFYMYHQDKITREGYSELFYPADIFYLLNATALLLMIWMHRPTLKSGTYKAFRLLGKCSLFLYISHAVFISFFLESIQGLTKNHWLTYGIFYAVIFLLAFGLNLLKKSFDWKKTPYIVRFLFGS